MPAKRRSRIKLCKEEGCKNAQTTGGYCRLHYLRNWRQIKKEQQKAAAERLNRYVDRMARQHPGRVVEEIKKDLRTRSVESFADDAYSDDDASDALANLFADVDAQEEVERLLRELKIEKNF
ncbi:MAG: hypothetical protein HYV02_04690 [Deltaproteobacteria bacterium]|nr:hypothetical protein [Deltaproteobacteria bacterium]